MEENSLLDQEMMKAAKAAANFYLKSKTGRRVLARFAPVWVSNAQRRNKYEKMKIHVPRFLFITINSQCNLRCAGCYARATDACGDICVGKPAPNELTREQWDRIFSEAEQLGISPIMVLGGETFLRMEILETAAKHERLLFAVFTNGTLIDNERLAFLDAHRNIIPLISIEGNFDDTDKRRGKGVSKKIDQAMTLFRQKDILFGASITTTTKNVTHTTQPSFVKSLQSKGCGIVYYLEYIPMEKGTEDLVLNAEKVKELGMTTQQLRKQFPDMIIYSAQGDENKLGGCQGAGRGFFHINASGGAEPCPFSPYSAVSLKDHSILEALESDFFKGVRNLNNIHAGKCEDGCTLHIHRDEVEKLSKT